MLDQHITDKLLEAAGVIIVTALAWVLKVKSKTLKEVELDVAKLKATYATKEDVRDIVKEEIEPIAKSTEEIKDLMLEKVVERRRRFSWFR